MIIKRAIKVKLKNQKLRRGHHNNPSFRDPHPRSSTAIIITPWAPLVKELCELYLCYPYNIYIGVIVVSAAFSKQLLWLYYKTRIDSKQWAKKKSEEWFSSANLGKKHSMALVSISMFFLSEPPSGNIQAKCSALLFPSFFFFQSRFSGS